MSKGVTWVVLAVSLVAVALSAWTWYDMHHRSKTAYIELGKVFNGFEMTQQYKKKLESVVLSRKALTDSLELNLRALSRTLTANGKPAAPKLESFEYEKQIYLDKTRQYEEDNTALKQQYDAEINKQINQYIKEFGDKNGYRYIYGADGSGSLMYAQEEENISDEVITFINERYRGAAK